MVVAECGQLVSRRRLVWLGASDGNSANGEPVPIDRPQTISLICTTGVKLVEFATSSLTSAEPSSDKAVVIASRESN